MYCIYLIKLNFQHETLDNIKKVFSFLNVTVAFFLEFLELLFEVVKSSQEISGSFLLGQGHLDC